MLEIDSFYLIALSVATGILIISLGFMGWMLSRQKDQINFPGITTTCPDFWAISEGGVKCELPPSNNFNIGTVKSGIKNNSGNSIKSIFDAYKKKGTTVWKTIPGKSTSNVTGQHTIDSFDSKDAGWGSGNDAICNKRKWAKDNNINWDTVTNVNFC